MLQEVMLAPSGFTPEMAKFPYLTTPKIDGIRFYIEHRDVWTRASKSLPNLHIRQELPTILPDGVDGELFCKSFSQSTSMFMADAVVPDCDIYIFDYLPGSAEVPYIERVKQLQAMIKALGWKRDFSYTLPTYVHPGRSRTVGKYRLKPLYPVWVKNHCQFEAYYELCLKLGHEGICLRSPQSPYKFGRCSLAENWLIKYKPFEDREARILGVEELMTNTNPQVLNELGHLKRSSHAAGMVPAGTFGSFHVRDIQTEVDFRVGGGPGLTHLERASLWQRRTSLPGKIIKYRSMPYGALEKPRQPQFIGFRDQKDMS